MKKLSLTLLLATLTSIQIALCCDCIRSGNLMEAQKLSYEESEFIFLGRVIELNNDGTYKLEILETFKGTERKYMALAQTHSCSIFPGEDEEYWLVYMDEPNKNEPATISLCGLSRSFKHPFLLIINDLHKPHPQLTPFFNSIRKFLCQNSE